MIPEGDDGPRTILVALDASPLAPTVLRAALQQARALGGRLVLLRAYGAPRDVPPEVLAISPSELGRLLESNAREGLERAARSIPPELLLRTIVVPGIAWEAICRSAAEIDADLVVIGSHGHSTWDRILGTTAARVVDHADRSVLVVRPRLEAAGA